MKASIAKIIIERTLKLVTVTINTARPGVIIGKGGQEVDKLKEELKKYKNIKTIVFNKPEEPKQETLPTKWFKTEQISTWIGKSITRITTEGESIDENEGGHGKLIVMHQCGENKEELISQLETMIYGLKEGFENFAN